MTLSLLMTPLLTGTGCVPSTGVEAPYYAEIIAPEQINIAWHKDYNDQGDGIGALLLLDFLVYNSEDGVPMDNIQVEVTSGYGGVYLVPKTAVKTVSYPDEPEDYDACDVDGDGQIDDDAPDNCSWWLDTSGNRYFQLGADFADSYRPTYMVGATDEHGVLRLYAYVDKLPAENEEESSFASVTVMALLGHDSDGVEITTD